MRRSNDLLPILRGPEGGLALFSPPGGASSFQTMRRMQDDLDRLFSQFLTPTSQGGGQTTALFSPHTDISETEREIRLEVDLPGVRPEDVDIQVQDNHLLVRAQTTQEQTEDEGRQYHRRERRFGYFQQVLPLPPNVDEESVKADFNNGVLTILVPKSERKPQGRRIQIGGAARESAPSSQAQSQTDSPSAAQNGNGHQAQEKPQKAAASGKR